VFKADGHEPSGWDTMHGAVILADAAKRGFGLLIFDLPDLQKKCKRLYSQRWTVFNSELDKTNLFRILPKIRIQK
jgi:hypothetical protein